MTTRPVCWESFVAVLCCVLWEVLLLSSLALSKTSPFLPLVGGKDLERVHMTYHLHPPFFVCFSLTHPLRPIRNGNSDIALPALDGRYWDFMFLFPGRDCWYAPCLAFSHSRMGLFWTVTAPILLEIGYPVSASETI